jgi:hypothetical protein
MTITFEQILEPLQKDFVILEILTTKKANHLKCTIRHKTTGEQLRLRMHKEDQAMYAKQIESQIKCLHEKLDDLHANSFVKDIPYE